MLRNARCPSFQVLPGNYRVGNTDNLLVTLEVNLAKCLANLILDNQGQTNPALLAMAHQIEAAVDTLKAA